jgi:hypothetical protein
MSIVAEVQVAALRADEHQAAAMRTKTPHCPSVDSSRVQRAA